MNWRMQLRPLRAARFLCGAIHLPVRIGVVHEGEERKKEKRRREEKKKGRKKKGRKKERKKKKNESVGHVVQTLNMLDASH